MLTDDLRKFVFEMFGQHFVIVAANPVSVMGLVMERYLAMLDEEEEDG